IRRHDRRISGPPSHEAGHDRLGPGQRAARRNPDRRADACSRAIRPQLHRQLVAALRSSDLVPHLVRGLHQPPGVLRTMARPAAPAVAFFFGLGSRYSYLAATQIAALAAETGALFRWRALHSRELIERAGPDPFRAEVRRGQYDPAYRTRDAERWARPYGVCYSRPPPGEVDRPGAGLPRVAAPAGGPGGGLCPGRLPG